MRYQYLRVKETLRVKKRLRLFGHVLRREEIDVVRLVMEMCIDGIRWVEKYRL